MHILITGGAGFIGSHLADALLEAGHRVRVLDCLDPQVHGVLDEPPDYLNNDVEFVRADVRDERAVGHALNGIEAVYHLAAAVGVGQSMYAVRHYMDVNTVGTAVLLEAVIARRAQVQRLIVASSMSVYGEGSYRTSNGVRVGVTLRNRERIRERKWEHCDPVSNGEYIPVPTDESKPLAPASAYAIGKRDQEELCLAIGGAYGIPTTALRYFNVYGERQALSNPYTGLAANIITRLANRSRPYLFEDGLQSRDFVHVSDVVRANTLALGCGAMAGRSYNVGSGRSRTVLEMASTIISAMGLGGSEWALPEIKGSYREGDIRHCFADVTLIRQACGYEPIVKFESGIAGLVGWCKLQNAADRLHVAVGELNKNGLIV